MAAPLYDSSPTVTAGNSYSGANVASLTSVSWTIGGSNRYLVAGACSGAGTPVAPTEMRWGGSTGTLLTKQGLTVNLGTYFDSTLYTLLAPTAQASTLYALWPSNQDETAIGGVSVKDVDQSTPTGTIATNTGTDYTPDVTVTTVVDDFVVSLVWVGDNGANSKTITADAGGDHTIRQKIDGGNPSAYEELGMSTKTATTTSTVIGYTLSDTFVVAGWAIWGVPLKPVAGGATGGGILYGSGPLVMGPLNSGRLAA